jgi:hypothetical protein
MVTLKSTIKMKKDKIQWLVSMTQILSSLAVLVSIIYLVIEYNRTSVLNEKSVENLVYARVMQLNELVIEHPDLAEIIVKAQNSDSLTTTEIMRYLAYEHIFYDSWETLWTGYQDGLVEEDTWNDWNNWFKIKAKQKPKIALQGNLDNLDTEFLKFIKRDLEID